MHKNQHFIRRRNLFSPPVSKSPRESAKQWTQTRHIIARRLSVMHCPSRLSSPTLLFPVVPIDSLLQEKRTQTLLLIDLCSACINDDVFGLLLSYLGSGWTRLMSNPQSPHWVLMLPVTRDTLVACRSLGHVLLFPSLETNQTIHKPNHLCVNPAEHIMVPNGSRQSSPNIASVNTPTPSSGWLLITE